jgi:alkaline phosphatase
MHSPLTNRKTSAARRQDILEEDYDYWLNLGREELDKMLMAETKRNSAIAKNVIIFVGDGMSVPTVTAARLLKAKLTGSKNIEHELLSFEKLDYLAHSQTYDADDQTADSPAAATALFAGAKTITATVGYDSSIDKDDPQSMCTAREVTTILEWAQDAGKSTGFVTNTRVTHATPSALYGHSVDREWECDNPEYVPDNAPIMCGEFEKHDLAWQMIHTAPGNKTNVIMGGGYDAFVNKSNVMDNRPSFNDPADDFLCRKNGREDGEDLISKWMAEHNNSELAKNLKELNDVDVANTDFLLGLFGPSHLPYDDFRDKIQDPSLADMTRKAMEILMKNDNGFFLMVEGGRIDFGHHYNMGNRALLETVRMDEAFEVVIELLGNKLDETLLIVTADHSHTMAMQGYSPRGADVRELSDQTHDDGLPYTLISYTNGPSYYENSLVPNQGDQVVRKDLTHEPITDPNFQHTSSADRIRETHGGDDVAIYASGPMAYLFQTTHEQTFIANVMSYSACIGPFMDDEERCKDAGGGGAGGIIVMGIPAVLGINLLLAAINRMLLS